MGKKNSLQCYLNCYSTADILPVKRPFTDWMIDIADLELAGVPATASVLTMPNPYRPWRPASRRLHGYKPLPVVISEGEGAWVTDPEGTLPNMLAGCSALNLGHRHPDLISPAQR